MSRTILAAALALLAVTAPAHAALYPPGTIAEAVDVQFSGGDSLAGTLDFAAYTGIGPYDPSTYYTLFNVSGEPGLTFDGHPTGTFNIDAGPTPFNPAMVLLTGPIVGGTVSNIDTSYIQSLNFFDFLLNKPQHAIGGTVACIGGCDVNAAPLPPALPLFAAGLLGLGAIGWRRGRKPTGALS